jgi:hypothetical protein
MLTSGRRVYIVKVVKQSKTLERDTMTYLVITILAFANVATLHQLNKAHGGIKWSSRVVKRITETDWDRALEHRHQWTGE